MTLVHIAAGVMPQPLQSYVIDDFGNLYQLCVPSADDYIVAAALRAVGRDTMSRAMRMLGE